MQAAVESAWHVYEGVHDGHPMYTRFNIAIGDANDRTRYAIRVGVAVPLNDPDDRGLPSAEELDELAAIEELILTAIVDHAALVGVITTQSMREFLLYTPTPDWIADFDTRIHELVVGHEVQISAKTDPAWTAYRQFVSS